MIYLCSHHNIKNKSCAKIVTKLDELFEKAIADPETRNDK